jgi:hypothetical protein
MQTKGIRKRSSKGHSVDWRKEIDVTKEVLGVTNEGLAELLGIYVQKTKTTRVAPVIYSWRRGQNVPPFYLLLALRHLRDSAEARELAAQYIVSNGRPPVSEA